MQGGDQHAERPGTDDGGPSGEEIPRPQIAPSAIRAATEAAPLPDDHTLEADLDEDGAAGAAPEPVSPGRVDAAAGDDDVVDDGADGEGAPDEATASGATVAAEAAPAPDDRPAEAARDDDADESDGPAGERGDEALDEDDEAWRAVPLTTRLEALLFAAPAPLSLRKLQALAGDVDAGDVRDALASLQAHYDSAARAFALEEIGGGFQLRTRPELSGLLARLGRKRATERLSPAALETLAIVAYRQPVLRVDVEKIRGVASGEVLRTLVEKGLVRVAGRADVPGSPLLYGTTPAFLELFGLRDLRDLPNDRELLRAP